MNNVITRLVLIFSSTALTLMASTYYIHMLQLEGYFIRQYLRHMFARIRSPRLIFNPPKQKKPLKYTQRVIRLIIILAVLTALVNTCIAWIFNKPLSVLPFPPTVLCVLTVVFTSFWVLVASLIAMPIEKFIAGLYVRDARKILKSRSDLKIIGITGSYGKTSTKFFLSTILSEKFAVLTPPSSYNTTMGVVRVIREQLQCDDEIFICEMGARHVGDIKEICDIVHPQNAIITSIGPQHLETFFSLDGVKKGKFELIEALPEDGKAVFASTNDDVLELYSKAKNVKIRAGFLPEDDVRAENITVGCSGSAFTLTDKNGESVECVTGVLGKHNISNILISAAMALEMGMTIKEVAQGIAKIKPVEHRLQIVNQSPVTVIDDAFNSSPNGARAALEVLGSFTGRRIIVTPGFVELGRDEDKFHIALGEQIKQNADIAILVGKKRTQKIEEGLSGFKGEIYKVDSLDEATATLQKITVAGDVVLFENDLPDNY